MPSPASPFRGAAPYRHEQGFTLPRAGFPVDRAMTTLLAHRLTWVYGPAGAGKSSLLHAILLPKVIADYGHRVATISLERKSDGNEVTAQGILDDLARQFGTRPLRATDLRARTLELLERIERRASRSFLILFDQMESLLDPTWAEEAIRVVSTIELLLLQPLRAVAQRFIVCSLREEYIGRLRDRFELSGLPPAGELRVARLTVAELAASAVELARTGEPAQTWDGRVLEQLLIRLRIPGQAATPAAEIDAVLGQLTLHALFREYCARGKLPPDIVDVDVLTMVASELERDPVAQQILSRDATTPGRGNLLGLVRNRASEPAEPTPALLAAVLTQTQVTTAEKQAQLLSAVTESEQRLRTEQQALQGHVAENLQAQTQAIRKQDEKLQDIGQTLRNHLRAILLLVLLLALGLSLAAWKLLRLAPAMRPPIAQPAQPVPPPPPLPADMGAPVDLRAPAADESLPPSKPAPLPKPKPRRDKQATTEPQDYTFQTLWSMLDAKRRAVVALMNDEHSPDPACGSTACIANLKAFRQWYQEIEPLRGRIEPAKFAKLDAERQLFERYLADRRSRLPARIKTNPLAPSQTPRTWRSSRSAPSSP